jgi:flagellar biosynthesis/type III secretory pathway M-ring protein FliF/YscJ
MLIVALVLAVIGLAALVTAVVTSNELIAWVCIAASVIGVVLLIVDALRERSGRDSGEEAPAESEESEPELAEDYPEEAPVAEEAEAESDAETTAVEQHDEDSNKR